MVVEVGGDDVGPRVVGGVLDGAEVIDLPVLGDDHHSPRVLAGGPADPGAALGQAVLLGLGDLEAPGGQVLLHVAVGGFLRHGADGPRPEHVLLAEELKGVPVGVGLVLPGEV